MNYIEFLLKAFSNRYHVHIDNAISIKFNELKEKGYTRDSFVFSLEQAAKTLKNEINQKQYKEQDKWNNLAVQMAERGEDNSSAIDGFKQTHNVTYTLNLSRYTKGQFKGNICLKDVEFIESKIEAFKNASNVKETEVEKSNIQPKEMKPYHQYVIGENIIKLQKLTSDYFPDLDINYERLIKSFELNSTNRTTIDFSKICTTKECGEYINDLTLLFPDNLTKGKKIEYIFNSIEFISSAGSANTAKTIKNWTTS